MDTKEAKNESTRDMFVLVALLSNEGSSESAHVRILARAFDAWVHKQWMQMKTQTKI